MKYLGIMKQEHGQMIMPDTLQFIELLPNYELLEISGDLLLVPAPLDRQRFARIQKLTQCSIADHRKTLEGLAR